MFSAFLNCWKIPELRRRILFTLGIVALARLGANIPCPGVNPAPLVKYIDDVQKQVGGSFLGLASMLTGGGLTNCAVFALGIMPYISASIIMQLLTAVIPSLERLRQEGETGRAKIIQYGRYMTILICLIQGYALAWAFENPQQLVPGFTGHLVATPGLPFRIMTVITITSGSLLLMWMGEQITERGIGNGVSLVITIGILARLPQAAMALKDMFLPDAGIEARFNLGHAIALLLLLAGVIAGVIAITQAQRKVPVQYAQRAVGRKVYSGGTSFMPLRVNYSGVMPIIFAQAILMFPQKIFQTLGQTFNVKFFMEIARALNEGAILYMSIYALMILFFSYFWVATQFNELQIADDLKKNGGYIPGVRPGQATSDYLHNAMSRITLAGAVFLTIIALIPIWLAREMQIPYAVATFFGGTSMLILVGVMLDTMRQMETHLLMRHYDGFLKKGKLRGRF